MKIEDMIVVSDLDGTLVPVSQEISSVNLEAIRRFRDLGGTFTIATGRSPLAASRFIELAEVRTPFIANNGAVLFDPLQKKPVWCRNLAPIFRRILREVRETLPEVGILVISSSEEYFLLTGLPENIMIVTSVAKRTTLNELPDNCCKVLFSMHPQDFERTAAEILSHNYPEVEFVKSGADSFEMMAKGVTKGLPLEELAAIHGKTLKTLIAVGDYYNDVGMLERAGFSAAMGNAPDDVKIMAGLVLPSCEEDGVAALLTYLIQNHDSI